MLGITQGRRVLKNGVCDSCAKKYQPLSAILYNKIGIWNMEHGVKRLDEVRIEIEKSKTYR
jgi:hypothetical protein